MQSGLLTDCLGCDDGSWTDDQYQREKFHEVNTSSSEAIILCCAFVTPGLAGWLSGV
jgi:hypothetical protein